MKLYVFLSSTQPNVAGFTADETGGNLPDGYGKWEGCEPSSPDDASLSAEQAEQIARAGYLLIRTAEVKPPQER